MGNGENILIKDDIWLAYGNKIKDNLPPDVVSVAKLVDASKRTWDFTRIRNLFAPTTAIQIWQTPIAW